jgi:FG-GAP-like repeat
VFRSVRTVTALVVLLGANARADTPAIFPAAGFPAGDGTFRVAVADFDGDALPDIVSSNALADTLTLLRGAGDATFYAPEVVASADRPLGLATGDFDGDGIADLVVAHADGDVVTVHLGQGQGAFGPGLVVFVGETPEPVAVGDLDFDGVLDVVVGVRDDGSISALIGDGSGQLSLAETVVTGRWPEDIVVADLVGDGFVDVCVGNSYDQNVMVLAGAGHGTFEPPVALDLDSQAYDLAVAELTGDALPDLAVASYPVRLFPGTGGDLGPALSLGVNGIDLPAGDFDGDGDTDLLASNLGGGAVLLQVGPGQFASGPGKHTGPALVGSVVRDMDADGALDFVATESSATTSSVFVVRGLGDGTFVVAPTIALPNQDYTDVLLVDFDLDGHLDLARGTISPAFLDRVEIRPGAGDGTFAGPVIALELDYPRIVLALDANNDGWMDLAAVSASQPLLRVALGQGGFGFNSLPIVQLPIYVYEARSGDFNADGLVDLALGTSGSQGPAAVQLRFGKGNGQFPTTNVSITVPPVMDLEAGDVNDDGLLDVVASSGLGPVAVSLATAPGVFDPALSMDVPGKVYGFDIGDLDADGFLDLLAVEVLPYAMPEDFHGLTAMKGGGDMSFTVVQQLLPHVGVGDMRLEDMDQDGLLDVVAVIPGCMYTVALGCGDCTFESPQLFGVAMFGPHFVSPGDIDDDGRMDLIVPAGQHDVASVILNAADGLWTSVGQGLAGSVGVPKLFGSGTLAAGTPVSLELTSAAPLAPAWLIVGVSKLASPFKGGTLVPSPDAVLGPLVTDAAGELSLQGTWPAGVPAGGATWLQAWVTDAAGPEGFAASHALRAVAP